MALDATVAGPDADSYATLAEAEVFVAWKQSATWDAASDALKESVLIAAVSVLDALKLRYAVSDSDQALRWPCTAHFKDGAYYNPERIKRAQSYLALMMLEDPDARSTDENVKTIGVSGSFSITFKDNGQILPTEIMELVHRDLWKSGSIGGGTWDSARRGFV